MVLAGTHPATATQTEITSWSSQSPGEKCNKSVYSEDELERVKSKLIGELSFFFWQLVELLGIKVRMKRRTAINSVFCIAQ